MSKGRQAAFLVLFLLAACAAVNLQRMVDPDLFWHLRAGKDILAEGAPLLPDSWTYTYPGKPWVNQQWLVQAAMFSAYDAAGYWGLIILKDLAAAGTVLLLLGALGRKTLAVRYLSAAFFVAVTARYFLFRTHIVSFMAMAALVWLLERVPARRRLWGLLPLFALWANCHALFGLGLLLLGIYCGVRWLEGGRGWSKETLWEWASVPACCLATLVNPFGIGVWKTALSTLGSRESYLISEWMPVWKHHPLANLGFFSLVLLLAVLIWLFPRAVHWPSLAAAAVFVALGTMSVRFTSDATIPALPLLASLVGAAEEAFRKRGWTERARELMPGLGAALVALTVLSLSWNLAKPVTTPQAVPRQDYPVKAVKWMKARGLQGKVFNEYDWGGYLAWAHPECKTFVDGRTAVLLYPPGFITGWKETVDLAPGWRERLTAGDPDFVLLYADDFLALELTGDPNWALIYKDDISALFGRARG